MMITIREDDFKRFQKEEYRISFVDYLVKLPDNLKSYLLGSMDIRYCIGKYIHYETYLKINDFISSQLGEDWDGLIISKYYRRRILLSRITDNKKFIARHWESHIDNSLALMDIKEFKSRIY